MDKVQVPANVPPNAQCVFKGALYEIWQWDQKMYDGSVEVFECIARSDSVDVIAVAGNEILLERQWQPDSAEAFLSLAGGRRAKNESPLAAAQRELLEEVGYESQNWTLWRQSSPAKSRLKWSLYTYIARDCVKISEPVPDSGEKIQELRISFDDFLLLSDNPLFRNKDLEAPLLRARYEPAQRQELFHLLFGSSLP